jgi:hypothetical protein
MALWVELDGEQISLWCHSGGDSGIFTYLLFDPINKSGVITFQNNMSGGALEFMKYLFRKNV